MLGILVILCFVGPSYCGINNVGIIGGHQITIKNVPYMASLRLNGTYHWCGASIISDRFVLTAAHCIVPNRTFKVLVGTSHVDGDGELFEIKKIILHEKWSNRTNNFDVALIKLSKALTFGPKVSPIKLADHTVKLAKNEMLNVTGWGSTGHNTYYSSNLRQVAIPKVTWKECQMKYLKIRISITHQMICAGKKGVDSCQGDSGGPLTKGEYQVGVTSFGLGCGDAPGVYAKVSSLLPWIKNTMSKIEKTL